MRATAATTTGRSTRCRAARSAATSGASSTARSTTRTIRSRANYDNAPGRDLWKGGGNCRDRRVPSFDDGRRRRQADVAGQLQRGLRLRSEPAHGGDGPLRAQQPEPDDRGPRRARERQRGVRDRQPRRRHDGDHAGVGGSADGRRFVPDAEGRSGSTTRSSSASAAGSRTTGSAAPT